MTKLIHGDIEKYNAITETTTTNILIYEHIGVTLVHALAISVPDIICK